MVLPLLLGALAPTLLPGMGALTAGALGAGLGGFLETGKLEDGLLSGLGAFAGGTLASGLMGSGASAAADAATSAGASASGATAANAAQAAQAGLPAGAAVAPPMRPDNLMTGAGASGGGGMFSDAMKFAGSPEGIGMGLGATAAPGLFNPPKDPHPKKRSKYAGQEAKAIPRIPNMPGADYQSGISGEWDYGIGTPYGADQIYDYSTRGITPYADGGMVRRFAAPNIPGIGPVRMAGGGIVTLAGGGDPGMQAPMGPEGAPNEREVISGAVAAIRGQHPQPEAALGTFLAMFGEDALRQLVGSVRSGEMGDTEERFATGEMGEVMGPGDGSGVDDMVPAQMDDGSDVLLSDGEYVLRKDAADSLERMYGGGFLDSVNNAGPQAAAAAQQRMALA